jgi:O-antigen/teichoic acid export membrane protein
MDGDLVRLAATQPSKKPVEGIRNECDTRRPPIRHGTDEPAMNEAEPAFEANNLNSPMRSSPKRLLSNPAVFGSLIPLLALLNAVVGMLLPKLMEPRVFGEYALVITLFSYGLIFDLGASQVMDRRILEYLGTGRTDLARRIGDQLLWMRLGIAVAAFLLIGLVLATLAMTKLLPFSLGAGLLATLAGLAYMVALGPVCIYRARSQRRNYAIGDAVLSSGLVIARLGGLIVAGLTGCLAALAAWYVTGAFLFHRNMPLKASERPSVRVALSLIGSGIPFFATAFIWSFYITGNRWIASFLIAPDQFGLFAFSANIFSLMVGSVGSLSPFYYPKIVERIHGAARYALSGTIARDLCGLVGVIMCVMGGGILLAGFLIDVIYPQYHEGIATARIILVAVPSMALAAWLLPLSQIAGNRPLIDGLAIYPLATVILGITIHILYHKFGDNGAAWASTISALPLNAMQLAMLRHVRILKTRDALAIFAASVTACVVLGLFAWRMSA